MIFFFYGEETYQSLQNVSQLKKKFLEKNPTGGGLVEFDCDGECDVIKIIQSFGEQNLFAQKKLIIIKNLFANTKAQDQKHIKEHLEKSSEDIIVFLELGKVRKNAALFKWLKENADKSVEYELFEGVNLENWIKKTVKQNGGKIDESAVVQLILFVGNDLWRLSSEIEKLICYSGTRSISVDDIEKLVSGRIDADMFAMIEAVASKSRGEALSLLNKQIVSGDDLFHIFSMYAYQIRTLLAVGSVMENGVSDKGVIAKMTSLHPFVVQKSISMVNSLSYPKIKQLHKNLTRIDFDIKQGQCDIETAMTLFVTNL